MSAIIIALIGAIVMACISRMHGGGLWNLPLGLDAWLFAIPFGVVAYIASGSTAWFIGALLTAFIFKRTGHGQYMDVGTWNEPVEPEKVDFLVQIFFGKDTYDNSCRDVFGLSLTGLLVATGVGLALIMSGHVIPALAILSGGALKGLAYSLGWILNKNKATVIGEYLTGFFVGAPLFFTLATL